MHTAAAIITVRRKLLDFLRSRQSVQEDFSRPIKFLKGILKKQNNKNHYKNSGVNVTTLSIMGESVKIMANLSTPRAIPAAAGMVTTSCKKRSDIGYTDLFIERRYF
jgi:hypothetical protein